MDFTTLLNDHFETVVVLACLIVGYLIKHTFEFISNKYIPMILALLGGSLNALVNGVSVDSIVYGAFMGLVAVGLHQVFKQWVEQGVLNQPKQ
jgi:hypothetical protein